MLSCKFGNLYTTEITGGSHEPEMTVTLTGLPEGFHIDMTLLQSFLNRRAPGNTSLGTTRREADQPLLVTEDGYKTIDGFDTADFSTITFAIKNKNYNTKEYNLEIPRPGHADLPAYLKYGSSVNMSGGGPFSGRMTAMMCISGGIALQILDKLGITIGSRPLSIGNVTGPKQNPLSPEPASLTDEMRKAIEDARELKDSVGGSIEFFATGLPQGLGGPMQDGCEGFLSSLLFGIPAVKAVEFGSGASSSKMNGSSCNDPIIAVKDDKTIVTETNNHGGILGGITTGMPLTGQVHFKPTPSIGIRQRSIHLPDGQATEFATDGRHDPCIIPRALPVVEAVIATGLLDLIKSDRPDLLEKFKEESQNEVVHNEDIQEPQDDLDTYRQEINQIDVQLQNLLDQRMKVAEKVAHYKMEHNMEIFHPEREKAILEKVSPLYRDIYQEIMNASKKIQKELMK